MPPSPPARRPRTLRQPRPAARSRHGLCFLCPRAPAPPAPGGDGTGAPRSCPRPRQAGGTGCPRAQPAPPSLRKLRRGTAPSSSRPHAGSLRSISPNPPIFSLRKAAERGGPGTAWGTSGPASPPRPGPGPGPTCEPQEDDPSQDVPIHLSQRCGRRERRGGGPARARAAPPAEPAGLAGRPRRVLRSAPSAPPPARSPGPPPPLSGPGRGAAARGGGRAFPKLLRFPPSFPPSFPPAKARLGCLVPLLGPRAPGTFPCKSLSPRHPPLSGAIATSLVSAEKCHRRSSVLLPKLAKWIPREMSVDDSCSKFPWGFHFQHEHSN